MILPLLLLFACRTGNGDCVPYTEVCDGVDNDCNGWVDDADPGVTDAAIWYVDRDGDGLGSPAYTTVACTAQVGWAPSATDCDDTDSMVDDAVDWYMDGDGDGYGGDSAASGCTAPEGAIAVAGDCDDTDPAISPVAMDVCNGLDDDCDGVVDPGAMDSDGDGVSNCVDPEVWSDNFDDNDVSDWTLVEYDLGFNWRVIDGALVEQSDAGVSALVAEDLGVLDDWSLQMSVTSVGRYNDSAGFLFAYQDTDNYWFALWYDPTGDYDSSYTWGTGWRQGWGEGAVRVGQCRYSVCTFVASAEGGPGSIRGEGVAVTLRLIVSGSEVSFYLDDTLLAEGTLDETVPFGPGRVGIWSSDADSGYLFDDFRVTVP